MKKKSKLRFARVDTHSWDSPSSTIEELSSIHAIVSGLVNNNLELTYIFVLRLAPIGAIKGRETTVMIKKCLKRERQFEVNRDQVLQS